MPLFVAGDADLSRAYYAKQPFDESTLDAPLGSGLTRSGSFEAGPLHRIRARQGLVGRRPSGLARADTISISCASNTTATATSALKASPARTICFARNSPRASGRRATIFRRSGRPRQARRCAGRYASGAQGWFINTRREQVQGSARARGLIDRLRFRMDQQEPDVRFLPAHPFGVPELRLMARASRRRASSHCSSRSATGCRRGVRRALVPPVTDGSGQDRNLLRKAPATCSVPPAGRSRTASASCRTASRSPSSSCSTSRSFEPHHTPFIKNLRMLGIDASMRLVDPSQCELRDATISISISPSSASSSPHHSRRVRCATISPAVAATQRLQQPRRHCRSRDRCAGRQGGGGAEPGAARHGLPRARSRCCAPAASGSSLEQGVILDRVLGSVRLSATKPRFASGRSGDLVVRCRQGRQLEQADSP